jgi:copper(I)-binding protein
MRTIMQLAFGILLALPTAALAHSFKKGDIVVGHPWTRATPNGAEVGAGYAKITNNGKAADRLTGGSFEGATVEIHDMSMDGGVMKMRQLKDGIEVAPGATIELKPGGNHLMFIGLKQPIASGADRKGTLMFDKAGAIDVEFRIEPIGATESKDMKHEGHDMKHDGPEMKHEGH